MCEVEDIRDDVCGCRAEEQNRDGGDHERAAEEEGLIPRTKKVVKEPTAEEVERHMATHIPFRDWCPHCVAGKSKTDPHFKGNKGERTVPKISLDYMYMTTGKQEEQMGMPILVGREEQSGWYMAAVVPSKGKCAHAVQKDVKRSAIRNVCGGGRAEIGRSTR